MHICDQGRGSICNFLSRGRSNALNLFHEVLGTQYYLVNITDELFPFRSLFGKLSLLQFFADMYPTLYMRTAGRGSICKGRRSAWYNSLDVLEDLFDTFGQVIKLGGFREEGRFRESMFNQYFS
jgi:hypothetical protein